MKSSTAMNIPEAGGVAQRITQEASAVIRGADEAVRLLTAALLCGGHVLLEDLPGTGKTTLVKAIAKATACDCKRVQCTPDLMPADLTGFEMLAQQPNGSRAMTFRKGPVFTNLLLADEINRMAPRSQAGLLECMAEYQVTCGGKDYALPTPFFVIATQNPIELQGTFPLPEAQLDRFFMRLRMGKPSRADELAVLTARTVTDPLDSVQAVTTPEELLAVQETVRSVRASDAVLEYILDLAQASREHPKIRYGLSTRAVLALRRAAQGYALLESRDHLLPDDVKAVFPAVCAHRLQASGTYTGDSEAADRIAAELLGSVPVKKS